MRFGILVSATSYYQAFDHYLMKIHRKPFRLAAVLFMLSPAICMAQDPAAIRSKCDQELSDMNSKVNELNNDYEQTKKDMQAGLYCSLCNQSKTELDKSYDGGFYKHVKDVKGEVKPANQKQMDAAHQRYLGKYNSLKSSYESKKQSCENNIGQAIKAQQQRAEQQRQQAIAEQNAKAEQARQKAEEEQAAKQQALQDLLRQQEAEQQAYRQKIIADVEQTKQDAIQMFSETKDRLVNSISGISMPKETIGFQGNDNIENGGMARNPGSPNVDEYESHEYSNVYADQFKSTVQDALDPTDMAKSILPGFIRNGITRFQQMQGYANLVNEFRNGNLTTEGVNTYFSLTPNAVIRGIQQFTGGIAVRQKDVLTHLMDRMLQDDFSEAEFDATVRQLNPAYALTSFVRPTQQKPWTMTNSLVVVGGAAAMSLMGVPVWAGMGVAAWYAFKH